jgi:hypothetical protein
MSSNDIGQTLLVSTMETYFRNFPVRIFLSSDEKGYTDGFEGDCLEGVWEAKGSYEVADKIFTFAQRVE